MSKPVDLPAEEVKLWPLILTLFLLAIGAVLNRRLGNNGAALVLVGLAVIIPVVGFCCRSYLSGRVAPRVRRVYVDQERSSILTVPLESTKYLTPPPRPGLPAPYAETVPQSIPELNWMEMDMGSDAESVEE